MCAALASAPAKAGAAPAVDTWVRPSPPRQSYGDPVFHDSNRKALTVIKRAYSGTSQIWRLPDSGARAWSVTDIAALALDPSSPAWWTYDPEGDRVLFVTVRHAHVDTCCTGGQHHFLDVDQLRLGGAPVLERIQVGGEQPFAMTDWASAWDPARQRLMIVSGIWYEQQGMSSSVFALDLSETPQWTDLHVPGPPLARRDATAWVDEAGDRLLLWGGSAENSAVGDTVWALPLANQAAWEPLAVPDSLPAVDRGNPGNAVLDEPGRRLILYSRYAVIDAYGGSDTSGVWQYDLATSSGWTELKSPAPAAPTRDRASVAYDPDHNRLSLLGGIGADDRSPNVFEERHDLVERTLQPDSCWTYTNRSAGGMYRSLGGGLVADRRRHQLVVIEGSESGSVVLWTIGLGPSQDWEGGIRSGGPAPLGRTFSATAFDSVGDRGILFGGRFNTIELNDVWQFQFTTSRQYAWTRLDPTGEIPRARWGAASVFDPVRRRLIVFGGLGGHALGDTWALSLAGPPRWTRIADAGLLPTPRYGASAVYDQRRDGMIVFGGNATDENDPYPLQDVWFLSFADGDRWLPLSVAGSPPVGRWFHAGMYDPARDRMLVFWGRDRSTARFDCAALELDGQPRWSEYSPVGPGASSRYGHQVAYDSELDMAAIVGGRSPAPYFDDDLTPDWYLDFAAPDGGGPPPMSGPPFALLGMTPNPTRRGVDVAFDLPGTTTVRARIYDARGRLVRELPTRQYTPGRHVLAWDGVGDDGYRPRPGVYFARLVLGAHEVTGKIVLLP